jgi:ribosomal protein S18 acetylase RimI-like enzyme
MSDDVMIGTLAEGEIAQVAALWHACGLTRPWNDAAADAAMALNGPSSTILAARRGAVLTGSVMVGHDGHRGWIYYMSVRPADQGRGVGRLLMRAAEDWLRARGVPKLNLMVRGDNLRARGFYEALGYAENDVVVLARFIDGRDS